MSDLCEHDQPVGECCVERLVRVGSPPARPDPADLSDRGRALASRLLNAAALDAIKPPTALIDGILYADSIAWLQGRPGHAKSFVALDMAGCLGTGENWQGHWVTGPHRVLYVAAEGASGLRQRVRAWEAAMGRRMAGVLFLPEPVQAGSVDWDLLVEVCANAQELAIVLDTQARLTVGMEENSARDMGIWIAQLERLKTATGACVLVVHHQGRSGEHMRGSTAMEGAATSVIQVTKDEELVTVRCQKQKDTAEFGDIQLRLVPYEESAVLALTDGQRPGGAPKWLATWWELHEAEAVSITTLVTSGVTTAPTFHRCKRELIAAGHIRKEGGGRAVRYGLTKDPAAGA